MKKILISLGLIVVLVIAAAVIIPFFVPMERYKSEISEQVKKATGRDFTIAGKLSLSLFPSIALEANDVSLANLPTSGEPKMASLDKLNISVKLIPLLSGQIVVDGFELVHPVIHLEVDKAGHGNWEFPQKPKEEETGKAKGSAAMLRDLALGDVRLKDGLITYRDARTGKTVTLSAINSAVSLPGINGPLKVDGKLDWNGQTIALNFTAANLKSLMDGQPVAITAKVDAKPVNFSLKGTATKAKALALDGDITLDVPSVRKLAAWVSRPLTLPGTGLGPLNIAGHLNMADKHYRFSKATIRLDNIHAKGTLDVATGGPRVKASGNLIAEDLDLNPYLPPEPPKKGSTEWSNQPIDMSGLKAADLSFTFKSKSLKYRKITIGASTLALNLNNGKLTATLKDMALYGGHGKGQVDIDGRGAVPSINATFDLAGVNAEPLLKDASDFERLSGTLKTNLNIETRGRSQRDMVAALNGKGAFKFADGTLKGVDLAATAATIEKISNGVKAGGANTLQNLLSGDLLGSLKGIGAMFGGQGDVNKSTKFTSLDATWTAKNGTVTNNDLLLIGPLVNQRALFKMTGKGQIMLPPQEINYEAEIRSFSKTAAGGGIGGTVRLSGPMADPSPCVVLGSLCIGKKTKPGDLLKMKLKGAIPGLGGSSNGAKPSVPSVDKLKDVFKGLTP